MIRKRQTKNILIFPIYIFFSRSVLYALRMAFIIEKNNRLTKGKRIIMKLLFDIEDKEIKQVDNIN
jgi:hypothetical protein